MYCALFVTWGTLLSIAAYPHMLFSTGCKNMSSGQAQCCVMQHILTATSAFIQAKYLEEQVALHDISGEQHSRQEGSAAMLALPLWQQDQIGQMQQKWLERLQRIRECCLPQANPGADH